MSSVAQEQKADLGYIDHVDRIEPHVAERQVECTLFDDTRRLAQIFLHKTSWAQMGPREARFFDIFLNFLVHKTKRECGITPRVQTREFDHVANSCGLASVYKRALRSDHIHEGS